MKGRREFDMIVGRMIIEREKSGRREVRKQALEDGASSPCRGWYGRV